MAYVLGVDLGGTKVLAGVIDTRTGKVLNSVKKRSGAEHTAADLVDRLVESASNAIKESGVDPARIERIGIGVAGQIDRRSGVVLNAPNLAHMQNVELVAIVKKKLSRSAWLFNDVEAAAAGEAAFGAGQRKKDFVVVFVGTGIGGAIYRNGKPYAGATNTAGELGHIVIDVNGRLCGCGGLGHLEAYASRTAIVRTILAAMHLGRQTVLRQVAGEINPADPGGSGIRSKSIAWALAEHDALVEECLDVGAGHLAAGLVSVINFYNPPLIILGGGLVEAVDVFFTTAATRARHASLPISRRGVDIVKAGLGDFSGVVGAAVLAASA